MCTKTDAFRSTKMNFHTHVILLGRHLKFLGDASSSVEYDMSLLRTSCKISV